MDPNVQQWELQVCHSLWAAGIVNVHYMHLADSQEAFSLFDTKADGCIYARQMGEVLRALGQNPTEAEIRKFGYAGRPGTSTYVLRCSP